MASEGDIKGASGYNAGRKSGMANSSINGATKKGGAGGNYTWGGAMDVIDYESVGLPTDVGVRTSSDQPAAVEARVITNAAPPVIGDTSEFPVLGATIQPRVLSSWGPGAAATILSPSNLRTGAVGMVGASHPRNLFAKKPIVRTTAVTAAPDGRQIDWSSQGMPPALVSAVLQPTAAHRGPYVQPAVPLALGSLQARNIGTQNVIRATQPLVSKQLAGVQAPRKTEMKTRRLC